MARHLGQNLNHRNAKSQSLASTCLGNADNVFALQSLGNTLVLNRRGYKKFLPFKIVQQFWGDAQIAKASLG